MMKTTLKRVMALLLALLLAVPALALSEDGEALILEPEQEIVPQDQAGLELELEEELDGLDDLDLVLDPGGDDALEIPEDLSVLDGVDEAGESDVEGNVEDGALASNDWEYIDVPYVDAKGKQQAPVKCAKVKTGNANKTIGNGWYAVTENVSYTEGMVV